jgi:hypothetical protein
MLEQPTANGAFAKDRVGNILPGGKSDRSDPFLHHMAASRTGTESIGYQRDTAIGDVSLASEVSARDGGGAQFRKRLHLLAPHFRRVLYKSAVGSPLVEGTDIPQANVVELMRLLRQRTAQPAARGGKLAGRLLLQLTLEQVPGPVTVEGVKVHQLRRLVNLLSRIEEPWTARNAMTAKSKR